LKCFCSICSIYIHGVNYDVEIPLIGPPARPFLEDEFLVMYSKKTIGQLVEIVDDGIYVVSGVVDGIVGGEDWWYPSCTCHRSVLRESRGYYCKHCVKYFFHMVPR
jgi:hypothetical protein